MTRYVLDTNVIVSALLFHASPPGQTFDRALQEGMINGRAEYIITGDADLLALDPFRGIKIMTPADFLRGQSQAFWTRLGTETGEEG